MSWFSIKTAWTVMITETVNLYSWTVRIKEVGKALEIILIIYEIICWLILVIYIHVKFGCLWVYFVRCLIQNSVSACCKTCFKNRFEPLVSLKGCWHNGKTIKWVCGANLAFTEERLVVVVLFFFLDRIFISVDPNKYK